jgi:hypothetical protein
MPAVNVLPVRQLVTGHALNRPALVGSTHTNEPGELPVKFGNDRLHTGTFRLLRFLHLYTPGKRNVCHAVRGQYDTHGRVHTRAYRGYGVEDGGEIEGEPTHFITTEYKIWPALNPVQVASHRKPMTITGKSRIVSMFSFIQSPLACWR